MKKMLLLISTVFAFGTSHAGFNGLTWHSRANCINNESIAWDWTTYRNMRTVSTHYKTGSFALLHSLDEPYAYTWRSAAVHYREAFPGDGWTVVGEHYLIQNNQFIVLGYTNVVNCDIYNGWWDFDEH